MTDTPTTVLRALIDALDRCEGNRGAFSCVEEHDSRCPLARAADPAQWRGVWQCECGRAELDLAMLRARLVLSRETEGA